MSNGPLCLQLRCRRPTVPDPIDGKFYCENNGCDNFAPLCGVQGCPGRLFQYGNTRKLCCIIPNCPTSYNTQGDPYLEGEDYGAHVRRGPSPTARPEPAYHASRRWESKHGSSAKPSKRRNSTSTPATPPRAPSLLPHCPEKLRPSRERDAPMAGFRNENPRRRSFRCTDQDVADTAKKWEELPQEKLPNRPARPGYPPSASKTARPAREPSSRKPFQSSDRSRRNSRSEHPRPRSRADGAVVPDFSKENPGRKSFEFTDKDVANAVRKCDKWKREKEKERLKSRFNLNNGGPLLGVRYVTVAPHPLPASRYRGRPGDGQPGVRYEVPYHPLERERGRSPPPEYRESRLE